jgi:hypothetical protein
MFSRFKKPNGTPVDGETPQASAKAEQSSQAPAASAAAPAPPMRP